MIEMKSKGMVILIAAVVVCLSCGSYAFLEHSKGMQEVEKLNELKISVDEMMLQWACIIGCFNAVQVRYDDLDDYDEHEKKLSEECCELCETQFPWDD